MNKENIPCCFSEVNEVGKHITNCNNLPTKLDKDNVQVRYFCEEHMIKIENIRRKMAKKYINEYKEKLINSIKKRIDDLKQKINKWHTDYYVLNKLTTNLFELEKLLEKIENGEID